MRESVRRLPHFSFLRCSKAVMKAGDLIEAEGRRWLVRNLDRSTRSAILLSPTGEAASVADDLEKSEPEKCKVLCNPATQWPFVMVQVKPTFGQLRQIVLPKPNGDEHVLVAFEHWVKPDMLQVGGAVFLNPDLRLGLGDMLVAVYERGRARVPIPRNFGTAKQRQARLVTAAPPQVPSLYERLGAGGAIDDDDE